MIKSLHILFLLLCSQLAISQCNLVADSLYKPTEKKSVLVSMLSCNLKNGGEVQFINNNGRFFLKLYVNEKFGFTDSGSLELKSGTKSFFVKSTTWYDYKQPKPYFLTEVFINYIATLKEDGLTAVVFNQFESKLAKEDTKSIKETAQCFYDLYGKKKK
jgi:hypothetical protein